LKEGKKGAKGGGENVERRVLRNSRVVSPREKRGESHKLKGYWSSHGGKKIDGRSGQRKGGRKIRSESDSLGPRPGCTKESYRGGGDDRWLPTEKYLTQKQKVFPSKSCNGT